ncbi:MAG: cysteine desulfurase-like protein [Acidimicrobiia bacterium]
MRDRFPGAADGWARFDGPAGTQMVDTAIRAMSGYLEGGANANSGGRFAASVTTGAMVTAARETVATLLGADPGGIVFGPNMTTLTLAFTRAVGSTIGAGDELLSTRLEHDSNVTPWKLAADDAGATLVLAPFDVETGRLSIDAIVDRIGPKTRWVTVTGASNALGTIPDVAAVVEAAHSVGARAFVDAVHLVPHRQVDIAAIGCDVLATSPYKWYGPHAGVLWIAPDLRTELTPYKVRPAPDRPPERWETGTPAYEAIAATQAAAEFLLACGMETLAAAEAEVFAPLLDGLLELPHVRVHGPKDHDARTPTVCFSVEGHTTDEVATALAGERIAVWGGSYYAVEVIDSLGLGDGGAIRAGISCYTSHDDVDRLLQAVTNMK